MYKKYFFLIAITIAANNTYSQYSAFKEERADSCTVITEKKVSNNRKAVMCRNVCSNGNSYYVELEDINGKGDFFRSGVSIWYYDDNFTKVRKRSTYWRGMEYGMVQEFYENGLLKMEGICKTIRYFHKYTGGKDKGVMCKVDLMDTTFFKESRFTRDSLIALDKYRYVDSALYNPSFGKSKYTLYFPEKQPQKFGEWKYYDETGKLMRREYYIKGVLRRTSNY